MDHTETKDTITLDIEYFGNFSALLFYKQIIRTYVEILSSVLNVYLIRILPSR